MNYKIVVKSLGILLICEAFAMMPSLLVSIIYKGKDISAFIITIAILSLLGFLMSRVKMGSKSIYSRDGLAIVALGWILISIFGCLPFYISGSIPSFIDCFFETISGFTTTGASILNEVESLPRGILFWRSFTHWIGGMGVLVFTLALLPSLGAGWLHVMKAESPGPNPGKFVPKVGNTAKILYSIYFFITILETALLCWAGLPLYDSLIHAFGTVGTGGFSSMNISVGAYGNVKADIIITIFMIMCGVNFTLYYYAIKGNFKALLKDEELRIYATIILVSIALIVFNTYGTSFNSIGQSIRHSAFQVASIMTTTGYSTVDFNQWPTFSKIILLVLMFIGGCAGSTGGGIKNIRILIMLKTAKTELIRTIHPKSVYSIKVNDNTIDKNVVIEIFIFFFLYILFFTLSCLLVSLDGFDFMTTLSSVAATISNIGPGFGIVGPIGNYSTYSNMSKLTLSFCMLIGRLEIYPMLSLLFPGLWKRTSI